MNPFSFSRDIFSLGFGPFRWVCTSGDPSDLAKTDQIAMNVLREIIASMEPTLIPLMQTYDFITLWHQTKRANEDVIKDYD